MYQIVYTKQAAKDIKYIKAAGLGKKVKGLINIVREEPFQNPPPYECLVGNLQGFLLHRINIQHRFVYQVIAEKINIEGKEYDGTVKIIRMWTHYEGVG